MRVKPLSLAACMLAFLLPACAAADNAAVVTEGEYNAKLQANQPLQLDFIGSRTPTRTDRGTYEFDYQLRIHNAWSSIVHLDCVYATANANGVVLAEYNARRLQSHLGGTTLGHDFQPDETVTLPMTVEFATRADIPARLDHSLYCTYRDKQKQELGDSAFILSTCLDREFTDSGMGSSEVVAGKVLPPATRP